jgi:predicted branched-subunit amino acid permease
VSRMIATGSPHFRHVSIKSAVAIAATVVVMTTSTEYAQRPASVAADAVTAAPSPAVLAIRDTVSVAVGMVSFGVTLGVTISVLGFGTVPGLVGAAAVYGGSAQLTAVTLVHQGAALLAVVGSAAIVNTRLLLYGAALSSRFRDQPKWFGWLAPHFIVDQTYLLANARPDLDQPTFRRYWGWLGGSVLVVWSSSIAIGILVGPALPTMPHLGFVGAVLFLGMLAPRLTNRPAVTAAVAGGLTAAVAGAVLPELGIVCGAVAGVAAGTAVRR